MEKNIDVTVLKKFMDDHDVSFEDMRSLLAEVSPPDLTINNVINLMKSKPYFEEEEDLPGFELHRPEYIHPDKTSGPTRSIDGKDVSPEELQKIVEERRDKRKYTNNRYEKYTHHDVEVWVRKDLKGLHKEYGLCWNCGKFFPKLMEEREKFIDKFSFPELDESDKENCPRAQKLYEYCCKNNIVAPVWECSDFEDWNDITEVVTPVTGEYFDDNERNERSEIG